MRESLAVMQRVVFCVLFVGAAQASTWAVTDVFVGVGGGCYKVYSNAGVFKEQICDGLGGLNTTGCAFNPGATRLYTTNLSANRIVAYDVNHPHSTLLTINPSTNGGGDPESLFFLPGGDFYSSNVSFFNPATVQITRYNAAGVFQQGFAVPLARTDHIDLAANQATMFYTDEGPNIHRFDVSGGGSALPDFATGLGAALALRLLPPFDVSGGLLVASGSNIKRLNSSGAVIQTYDSGAENCWFALNLDPNGTSFWSGDICSGNFYRFNIATGAVELGPINGLAAATGGGLQLAGICLLGEITSSVGPGGGACGHHTVHGHISTVPPTHTGTVDSQHHGTHNHSVPAGAVCPPHAPGHSAGLLPDQEENFLREATSAGTPNFVAALNSDGTEGRAARGAVVELFGSAQGLFLDDSDRQPAAGVTPPAAGSPLYYTTSLPEVRIGGAPAKVLFSGLAPGLAGVWQINVVIPEGLQSGTHAISVNYEGDTLKSVPVIVE